MSQIGEGLTKRPIESYRDLRVWQVAMDLAVACYDETKAFPTSETYGLTSQIRRSGASVAANIAEGYGREQTGSYVQFLRTAQGSLKELETHIIIATRVGYLTSFQQDKLLRKSEELGRCFVVLSEAYRGVSDLAFFSLDPTADCLLPTACGRPSECC